MSARSGVSGGAAGGDAPLPPSRESVCAVLVTYEPPDGLEQRVQAVLPHAGHVVVVDNRSAPAARRRIRDLVREHDLELIENDDNLGLATALNEGARRAIALGAEWVLTLDQDTVVLPSFLDAVSHVYRRYERPESIGLIGVNVEEAGTGRTAVDVGETTGPPWVEAREIITSGSLLPLRVYERVGPFRDELFIDLVDFEYCHRVRSAGLKILVAKRVGIVQRYGDCTIKQVLGMRVVTRDYSPTRTYYRTRNAVVLMREQLWDDPLSALTRIWAVVQRAASILVFEAGRRQKLRLLATGIVHGLRGRLGPYEVAPRLVASPDDRGP